jgi:branched-chain amino acid transport system ATP-binding protein
MFFEIEKLHKRFGGLKAINDVNLSIKRGEICSVIGPNGAGKTTLFNLITGYIKPDSGKILFMGEEITGKEPRDITKKGIARSFQIVNIFPKFTVYENIMVSTLAQQRKSLNLFKSARPLVKKECISLIESIGLAEDIYTLGGELSHGNQKRLEVGIALSLKPKLLLLDEPTAGMASEEKEGILKTVKDMIAEQDCTVFLCEHDMSVIFSVSNTILCLANGGVVACGNSEEIQNNTTVKKIYLGESS